LAEENHAAAESAAQEAETARAQVQFATNEAGQEHSALGQICARLADHTQGLETELPVSARPYADSLEAAAQAAQQKIEQHTVTRKQGTAAERRLEQHVTDLKDSLGNVTYQHLDIPLRQQISNLDRAFIPGLAAQWTTALERRVAALSSQLAGVEEARDSLVAQLANHVSDARQKLDHAVGFSQFPDGCRKWSGQKFLDIRYRKPDRAALTSLIRQSVEELAAGSRAKTMKGMDLVLHCLHKAIPGGFHVKVLKPTASGHTEYVSVEDMSEVFSGGQELTGAILLYCTLAALCTSPSPRSRTRHGGVLLLDNPIGRANAPYLVDLQQDMAAALGIQLIYTTGLTDEHVMTRFPLRIQLRNDAEARSGLSLVPVSEHVHNALAPDVRIAPDPDAPEPVGYLSAARVYAKEDLG
jgi:DNA segregation ATPase FtsK/SpoIIIE-like protein